jgi:hypothetical protein
MVNGPSVNRASEPPGLPAFARTALNTAVVAARGTTPSVAAPVVMSWCAVVAAVPPAADQPVATCPPVQ